MLTLEQRRALKLSASRGDVHATQALWNSIEDDRVSFVGRPRLLSSPTRPKSRGARWSSDDLLRLPARVISGVSEPLARYPLPRRRAMLGGAAAHLGGGRPSSVSSSIEGSAGRLAVERRVPDGFSPPRPSEDELLPAPALASDLGWFTAHADASDSMLSMSMTGLSLSRLTLDTSPGKRRSQPSLSALAAARPPSRSSRSSRARGASSAGTSRSLGSSSSDYQPSAMALINPSRRDIATGMALPIEPPRFAPDPIALGPADRVALDDETLPPGARSERLAALASPSMVRAWSAPPARGQPDVAEQQELQTSLEVEQTLAELRRQRLGYEHSQSYMEADAVRRRAEDVALADSSRKRDALVVRQVGERAGAEDAYALEHASVLKHWEAKMEHFEQQAAAIADALARRHERELDSLRASFASKPAPRARPATAQSSAYKGEKGRANADPSKELESPLTHAIRQLTMRQRAEVSACEQRVLGSRRTHRHQRARDLESVQRRFANILSELATQQRAEQVRLERAERLHTIRFELGAGEKALASRRLATSRYASHAVVTSTIRVEPSVIR